MNLAFTVAAEHDLIRLVHTMISAMFLIVAVWLFYRSFTGFLHNREYVKSDKILAWCFIVGLYLQLIFGLILFSSPATQAGPDLAVRLTARRFWPVEHIVLMLFALFIANLGLIFSANTQVSREKHRKILVYYAISVILIILSLGSTFLE